MDDETKGALQSLGTALKATNDAVDSLRAHLAKRDATASILIQAEISRANTLLDHALEGLGVALVEAPAEPAGESASPAE